MSTRVDADNAENTQPDAQTEARAIETLAWNCDEWPEWLHKIVDQTNEVADRLDMSSEQAHAFAVLTALASLSAKVEELTRERDKKDALWRETAEQAQENFDNWLRDIDKLKTAEASLAERDRIIAEKDKALDAIKARVTGDRYPNWYSSSDVTNNRMWIADICDAARRDREQGGKK